MTLDPRSTNYGTNFTLINSQLDPNLLLWPIFYVSAINPNMVCLADVLQIVWARATQKTNVCCLFVLFNCLQEEKHIHVLNR